MSRPPSSGSSHAGPPRPGGDRRKDRRGPPPSGRGAVEAHILEAAKALDKPLVAGDFAAQEPILRGLRERVAKVKPSNLASFDFDPRTRLFTALLRVGRQTTASEQPEKEEARRRVFAELGALWKVLSEEERAAQAFASAGDAKAAIQLFQKAGDWEEAAALHVREGRASEAAKLYEQHGQLARAAAVLENAEDHAGALRALVRAKDLVGAREIARKMPTDEARKVMLQEGAGDLLLDFLAARGRWEEIGKLYARAGQHADAAQAFLKVGRTHMAIESFHRAGDEPSAQKVIEQEAEAARAKGDAKAVAEVYARWKLFGRAAETIVSLDPLRAVEWVGRAGDDPRALELARREAERARQAGDIKLAARWLEKLGSLEDAARTFMESGEPHEALRLFEQLGDWRSAGACAEQVGEKVRAAEFYERAGDREAAARARGGAA